MCTWDGKFIGLTNHIAQWSKDKSRKVGCVFVNEKQAVLSMGYNGFPRGVNDDVKERYERPAKYMWTEHSERNAIYNAAYEGVSLRNSTAYVTFFPCTDCARGMIQCGVKRVVAPEPDYTHHKYGENFRVSKEMLEEAGIKIDYCTNTTDGGVVVTSCNKSFWKRLKASLLRNWIKIGNKMFK